MQFNGTLKMAQWPRIYTKKHLSGKSGYVVDAGKLNGNSRYRKGFKTLEDARQFAKSLRKQKDQYGKQFAEITLDQGYDLGKANEILAPYGKTIVQAAEYYRDHCLLFRESPCIEKAFSQYMDDCKRLGLRSDSLRDINQRLSLFLTEFGKRKPNSLSFEELNQWFRNQDWNPRNFINYRNKILGFFNHSKSEGWIDENIVCRIKRPKHDPAAPQIYSIQDIKALLYHAGDVGLLPYISIGLFAGLRPTEMSKLDLSALKTDQKVITVDASVAKGRSQRNVDIQPVLLKWIEFCDMASDGPLLENSRFRSKRERLTKAAGLSRWIQDGLRHSFGSYHFAKFGNEIETSRQMGHRGTEVFHTYYKALVTEADAEEFWVLTPDFVFSK